MFKKFWRTSRSGIPAAVRPLIEELESRTLLSGEVIDPTIDPPPPTDVELKLQLVAPSSKLLPGAEPSDLIFDSTRQQLLVVEPDQIKRYSASDGTLLGSIIVGQHLAGGDITQDGSYLYLAEVDNRSIYKIDLATGAFSTIPVTEYPMDGAARDVVIVGSTAIVSQYPNPYYRVDRLRTVALGNDSVANLWLGNYGPLYLTEYVILARSADYSYASLVSPNNDYSVSGAVDGRNIRGYGAIQSLAVSRDGAFHAVSGDSSGLVVLDRHFDKVADFGSGAFGVAFDPTRDLMYVASYSEIRAYDTGDWLQVFSIPISGPFYTPSPYGAGVMSVSDDGNAIFLAMPSGVLMVNTGAGPSIFGQDVLFHVDVSTLDEPAHRWWGNLSLVDSITGEPVGLAMIDQKTADGSLSGLHAGHHQISAVFDGDALHNPAQSAPVHIEVTKTIADLSLVRAGPDSAIIFSNLFRPRPRSGTITILEGSTTLATLEVSPFENLIHFDLPLGPHTLTLEYSGNEDFLPSTLTTAFAVQEPTTTSLSSSKAATQFGEEIVLTATVNSQTLAPSGSCEFFDGQNSLGAAPLDSLGHATIKLSELGVGAHSITVSFAGYSSLNPSTSPALLQTVTQVPTTIAISAPLTSTPGGWLQINSNLRSSTGAKVRGGSVVYKDGNQVIATEPVIGGHAPAFPDLERIGLHTITATYQGNETFGSSIAQPINIQIIPGAVQIRLSASSNYLPTRQMLTWRATLAPLGTSGNPSGTVIFKDGKRKIGSAVVSDGVATFQSKALPPGVHRITAIYPGDGRFKQTASKAVASTVYLPTIVDLMIVYTPAAQHGAGGATSDIRQLIDESVTAANQAFWNSRIPVLLRLVHAEFVPYLESGKLDTDLDRLQRPHDGYMDIVPQLRNTYRADLVSLFESDGDSGGLAFELRDTDASGNANYAYSVLLAHQAAAPSYTLAHELGHNLGATHDIQHSDGRGATSYSSGWRFRGNDGVLYHDIMAYDPGETIPYFSNPRLKYKGAPLGTGTADASRTITLMAPYVAKYR